MASTIYNQNDCLYEATLDDLVRAFMHITDQRSWLKGGSHGKGDDMASLKLKVVSKCMDP